MDILFACLCSLFGTSDEDNRDEKAQNQDSLIIVHAYPLIHISLEITRFDLERCPYEILAKIGGRKRFCRYYQRVLLTI